ncbi:hypothetical protein EA658_13835 [Pseudoxanthomonas winnipegensis]|uniref:Uncharacterized protein n=1 Tax=Pseudoxanthomonas winnipegensis TaxID=2480810 RepID=A0ABY1WB43_9GAMM|nr:hypothetical protein [Pseudoxanthomonas winnipegensis]TAA18222.1 hypothetical protein EA658_13835 [Pseudoxanthomonas winnipegensis]
MDITDRLILIPLLAYQAGTGPTQLIAMFFRPIRPGDRERLPDCQARRAEVCPLVGSQHHVSTGVGIEQGQVDEGAGVVIEGAVNGQQTVPDAPVNLGR